MDKYQEVLNRLNTIDLDIVDGEIKLNQSVYGIHDYANLEMKGDLIVLQELVDKEKPMKPKTKKYSRGSEWNCPRCKHHIAYFDELGIGTVRDLKYCDDCGQRLNLGKEETEETFETDYNLGE